MAKITITLGDQNEEEHIHSFGGKSEKSGVKNQNKINTIIKGLCAKTGIDYATGLQTFTYQFTKDQPTDQKLISAIKKAINVVQNGAKKNRLSKQTTHVARSRT